MLRLLVLLLFLSTVHADCPSGSIPSIPPSKCFYFMTTSASYTGAHEICKNISANLVSLHDRFTDSFLGDKSGTIFNEGATDFWIGATGTSFDNWLWSDGSPTDYQDWGSFNPSGTCGVKRISDGYWNLVDCSQTKPYVCQIDDPTSTPFTTAVTTQPNCSSEWFYFEETNSCYFWTDKFSWSDAENFCVQNDAHLASVHSFNELNFTKTIYNGALWIGLRSFNSTVDWNTYWQWSDGSVLDYSLWGGDEMPTTGSSKNCVYTNSRFVNYECSYKFYGLCKKPSANLLPTVSPTSPSHTDCSDGWTYFEPTNSCFYFKTSNTTTTWQLAEDFCVNKGAHLASIHSIDELNFVQAFAPYYPWIGLTTNNSPIEWNSTWLWSDNTLFDFEQWGYWNMPSLDDKLCVYLSSDGFRNVDCKSATSYAVCKKSSSNINPTVSSTPSTPANICPPGWGWYSPTSSCFISSSQPLYNWTSAEEYCAFNGGHLASFHSDDENYFIYNNILSYVAWIGLYTKDTSIVWNSTWYWTDNTAVDYLPWRGGIPSFNGLLCTTLYGITFSNMDCSQLQYALCKKPANNPTHIPPTPTPTAPSRKCPTGFDYYNTTNSCYMKTSGNYNWTTMIQYCASYDSQLVSIHNLDEYKIVLSYIDYRKYLWIGLYSDTNAITWKWKDGSAFDYPYWASNYPDRGGPVCGSIYYYDNGFSNSQACENLLYGILLTNIGCCRVDRKKDQEDIKKKHKIGTPALQQAGSTSRKRRSSPRITSDPILDDSSASTPPAAKKGRGRPKNSRIVYESSNDLKSDTTSNETYIEDVAAVVQEPIAVTEAAIPMPSLYEILSFNDFADVIITSSDGQEIQTHRNILSKLSPVMNKIFKESTELPVKINVEDFDADTIKAAIEFCYGKMGAIHGKESTILKFATKCDMLVLKQGCVAHFKDSVTAANVCELIQIAYANNFDDLKKQCLKVLVEKQNEISFDIVGAFPGQILADVLRYKAL